MAGVMTNLRPLSRQRGFGFWGTAINVLILAGVLVLMLRVAPNYLTYMTVKDIVHRAASEYDRNTQTIEDLRTHIRKLLHTSQVYAIGINDIKIYRERGTVMINANYEARFPLFWIVDGVMTFDDLVVEASGRTGDGA